TFQHRQPGRDTLRVMVFDLSGKIYHIGTQSTMCITSGSDGVSILKAKLKKTRMISGVTIIPKVVGTAQNGKLKASEWQSLYSQHLLLLVLASYAAYCKTSALLFPDTLIRPNHQYALNIGELSRKWGPLLGLAEFGGEQLNGTLQSLSKMVYLVSEIEGSMMKIFCQIQQLAHKKEYSKLTTQGKNKGKTTLLEAATSPESNGSFLACHSIQLSNLFEWSMYVNKNSKNGIWWDENGGKKYGFEIHILRVSLDGVALQVVLETTNLINFKKDVLVEQEWKGFVKRMKLWKLKGCARITRWRVVRNTHPLVS
ncbi:hypothetical protein VP01_4637g1, partial [Puccinia sorghi]